jgi:hypothetical protein
VRIIVDGIEDRSGVVEKSAKPGDHQAFQIVGRYIRRPLEWFLPAPVRREVET